MSAPRTSAAFAELKPLITGLQAGKRRLTVLTGAGVSTESGVPDFRSPGSPWLLHPPIDFKAFVADPVQRAEAWRRKFAIDDRARGAKPGPSHIALAALAARGIIRAVVTQNVDGLHQVGGLGNEDLVELHGNGTYARCLSCRLRVELSTVRQHLDATGEAPLCACGGLIKSATIGFGQSLEPTVMEAAIEASRDCDVFLVAGSSLLVRPAAQLPLLAKERNAKLVIVNREPTPLDHLANHVVRASTGSTLSAFACWH